MRWPWQSRPVAGTATLHRPTATMRHVAQAAGETSQSYIAKLARDTFAILSNPRRRKQRRGSGAYHRDYESIDELRRVSRWQEDHAGTYAGPLSVWENYLIGTGPEWVPATSDPAWNAEAAQILAADLTAKKHDARHRFTWAAWLKLLARSIVRDGQMGVAHSATGAAQLIEAERIIDVESNKAGQVISWKIADWRGGQLDLGNAYPVSSAMIDVCQIVTRTSQWFGVPLACSTLDDHDGVADLWGAEIDTAAEAVRPWMIIEHAAGSQGLPGGASIPDLLLSGQDLNPPTGAGGRDSAPAGWVRSPNGNIMGMPAGLTGKAHQPMRPNMDVPAFCKEVLRVFSLVLLPYELLFMDFVGVNHSNGRGIVRLGNSLLKSFWETYLDAPATRVAHGLLRTAIADGRLRHIPDWRAGSWQRELIPEHDRLKERQADSADLANGTTTLKDLLGETWQATLAQSALEKQTRAKQALRNIADLQTACNDINQSVPGLNIHWSHLVTIDGANSAPGAYLQGAAPKPTDIAAVRQEVTGDAAVDSTADGSLGANADPALESTDAAA